MPVSYPGFMETLVWIILSVLLCLIGSLPFTYNWVSKRNQYLAKLNSIGLEENSEGLIVKLEGTAKPVAIFFPSDPAESTGSSKNPGFIYAASGTTMLLPNAAVAAYYFVIYKKRVRYQRRIYNQTQLNLLEQIEMTEGDCSHLKDVAHKLFCSS